MGGERRPNYTAKEKVAILREVLPVIAMNGQRSGYRGTSCRPAEGLDWPSHRRDIPMDEPGAALPPGGRGGALSLGDSRPSRHPHKGCQQVRFFQGSSAGATAD